MKMLPPEERCLLDLDKNTFNFAALWMLMKDLRINNIMLPIQIPTSAETLNAALQEEKLTWIEYDIQEIQTVFCCVLKLFVDMCHFIYMYQLIGINV